MFHMEQKLIGPTEAASILNKPRQTVTRWCREGKLRAWRVGKSWVIDHDSLKQYVAKHTEHTKGDN